jgi:uncharacterized SAM-binding protein YcdF (DUF218 family)
MPFNTAIVCMAYGTDLTGFGPSPMAKDIVAKARTLEPRFPGAGYILQGGYSYNGGPTESKIMAKMLADKSEHTVILTDTSSMNTIEGAEEIIRFAKEAGYNQIVIVAERFHLWRVQYTFRKLLKGTDIQYQRAAVDTPFGGNSQSRLNSAWNWWTWEILARIYTILFVH